MSQMHQNQWSEFAKINQSEQNREDLVTEMVQMNQNGSSKWIEMNENRPKLTKIIEN